MCFPFGVQGDRDDSRFGDKRANEGSTEDIGFGEVLGVEPKLPPDQWRVLAVPWA